MSSQWERAAKQPGVKTSAAAGAAVWPAAAGAAVRRAPALQLAGEGQPHAGGSRQPAAGPRLQHYHSLESDRCSHPTVY